MKEHTVVGTQHAHRCLCWSAIILGAIVGLALSFIIHLFNVGVGLITLSNYASDSMAVTVGGFIWLVICAFLTMFPAGWVAGKLSRSQDYVHYCHGMMYGFFAWCLIIVLTVFMVSQLAGPFYVGSSEAISQRPGMVNAAAATPATMPTPRGQVATTDQAARQQEMIRQMAESLGAAALSTFFILLLGAIFAILGGLVGQKSRSCPPPTTTTV